jgi:hypothetical protein
VGEAVKVGLVGVAVGSSVGVRDEVIVKVALGLDVLVGNSAVFVGVAVAGGGTSPGLVNR